MFLIMRGDDYERKKEKNIKFPKEFFEKSRQIINTKESLKDIIPLEWSKEVLNGEKKQL